MRWFSRLRSGRSRRARRRRSDARLRVRQLERRRVLDAAISSLMVAPVVAAEGQNVTATATATGSEPLVFDWSVTEDGTQIDSGTNSGVNPNDPVLFNFVLPDDTQQLEHEYKLALTVTDADATTASAIVDIEVTNVAPVLVVAPDQTVNEGQLLDLSGIGAPPLALFVDAGKVDTHTATIEWGDGSPLENATVFFSNGSGALGGTHTYADDGIYTVIVTVLDDDGGSDAESFDVTVNNLPPVLVVAPDQVVNEGQLLDLSGIGAPPLALFVDAGQVDTHTATIDWGDGSALESGSVFISSGSGALGGTHTYADDGVYTVTVTITDDNGGSDSESFEVTVNNVAPVLVPTSDQMINEGQPLNLSGIGAPPIALFVDQGKIDTHTATIDWGDGSPLTNAAVFFSNGSGALGGTHTYADNGVYTVTLTVTDDDGGSDTESFQVIVKNVVPTVANANNVAVNEGSAFTLVGLNVLLSDAGFDNPLNPLPGGELQETFAIHSINWGDGSPTDTSSVSIVNRVSGGPGVPTTAQISHAAHTYADDGFYTVTVRVADDDIGALADPAKFVTGVAGVDFVDITFTIRARNVAPTLTSVTPSVTTINESESVSFTAQFSDPGFDNPLNPNAAMPPTIIDPLNESFTYDIDWGDGRQEEIAVAVADLNGSPGVPSTGMFGGMHVYADDGTYTVTVRIHDDNGGVHIRTFEVLVENINPAFVPPPGGGSFEGDDVSSEGITTIRVDFNDPGFDNLANPNSAEPPSVTDTLHESFTHVLSWGDGTVDAVHTYVDNGVYTVTVMVTGAGGIQMFSFPGFDSSMQPVLTLVSSQAINDPMAVTEAFTYVVDWGDGNVQTIPLLLKQPGAPVFNNGLTTVLASARASGGETVLTTGSFDVQHRYLGPPNPANPSADIRIDVTIVDDNNGSVTDFIEVPNPGTEVINVAIDTTPDVPRLDVTPLPPAEIFVDELSSFAQNLEQRDARVVTSELLVSSERYLMLEVIAPDGTVISAHRIRDEALNDLRAFFASLPDNHYRIYLVRTDNNTRRLIMDVYVRRGRVIDPSDDSEGTRDRPPMSDELRPLQPPPLEHNPNLQPVPDAANNVPDAAAEQLDANDAIANDSATDCEPVITERSPGVEPVIPLRGSHRWVVPLVGFGLAASRGSWSQRVAAALENANQRDWHRLRRAGRLAGRAKRR